MDNMEQKFKKIFKTNIEFVVLYMAVIIPSSHFAYKQFIKHVLCAVDIDQLNLHPVTFQQYNATCY